MRSVVIKIVCNDRIIAFKIKAEMVKYFVHAGVHANIGGRSYEKEELYVTTKEILKQDGKGETITTVMGEGNNVVVYKIILKHC
jgi:hypothetical protein